MEISKKNMILVIGLIALIIVSFSLFLNLFNTFSISRIEDRLSVIIDNEEINSNKYCAFNCRLDLKEKLLDMQSGEINQVTIHGITYEIITSSGSVYSNEITIPTMNDFVVNHSCVCD